MKKQTIITLTAIAAVMAAILAGCVTFDVVAIQGNKSKSRKEKKI